MHLRTATLDDVPALHDLWRRAFDAPLMVPVHETDAGRLGRTVVAVDAGRVLASVYWVPREIGAPDGGTLLAGGVANVASAPEARGRGLVRGALAVAVEQMTAAGADVSLLFTGTPDVYRSSGWETFDVPVLRGAPRLAPDADARGGDAPDEGSRDEDGHGDVAGDGASAPAVRVDRLPGVPWPAWSPALAWEQLAALHDALDTTAAGRRPLATRRTAEHWERRIPLWYSGAEVLTARSAEGDVLGYVVLEPGARSLSVRELGVDPASPVATRTTDALARATCDRARHHDVDEVEVRLPAHPVTGRFATAVLADPVPGVDRTGMLRPVGADRALVDDLRATTTDGRAGFHWPGDYL